MPDYLYRRNVVLEALRGERRGLRRLWLQDGLGRQHVGSLEAAATARGLPVERVDKGRLSRLAGDTSHQGTVLEADAYPYATLPEILDRAVQRGEPPLILLLDLVQGPQNVGVLLRTAEACGVHGVVMQARRAPDVTPSVVAFAAGATEHLLIAQETNLNQAIEWLRSRNVWVAGLDTGPDAQPLGQVDLDRSLALVVGHEGEGLRRLVRDRCDFIVALPMRGQVASLNAAAAGSIALYAAWAARGYSGASG